MGAWGIKALESDNGLDVIDFLESFYKGRFELSLSEIITQFTEEGFLSEDKEEIDYLFDNTAIAIAELVFMFKETKELNFDNENEEISLRKKTDFKTDKTSLEFILQHLLDIKNEKPDEDGEREYVELWKDSDSYEKWKQHLDYLISKLNYELQ